MSSSEDSSKGYESGTDESIPTALSDYFGDVESLNISPTLHQDDAAAIKAIAGGANTFSVLVSNIPVNADENSLKELFEKVGPIAEFDCLSNNESGHSKRYIICQYYDNESANKAIKEINNYELDGVNLTV